MATPIPTNRCEFTLTEAAAATGGRIRGNTSGHLRGVSIDTRTMTPGALFVALRGAVDGHQYLPMAFEHDAAAAIVATGRSHPTLPCIEVADTLDALGRLARHHLARMRTANPFPVIAIGGAAGKTSTKELTAAAARALFGATLSTPGNLNNLIGVPMTIFTLIAEHRAAVLECGTNTRGEIPRLAQIVAPDVAMVLNVDLEHTEGLGTLEDVADEEAALFSSATRFAVTSSNEPLVLARIPSALARLTFGKSPDADFRLARRSVAKTGRSRIRIEMPPTMVAADVEPALETEIALLGESAAINCTAAIAGVAAMRSQPLQAHELDLVADALTAVQPVAGRLAMTSISGLHVIDDTYNSNPRSIRAALAAAREISSGLGARLIIAMGDMLELGAMSRQAHQDAIRDLILARPAALVAVGPEMRAALDAITMNNRIESVTLASDSVEAGRIVTGIVHTGDVVLVKGSRGIAMERVIEALR